ncbi:MAG: hypothetical protein Q8K79_05885 [Solirubrobacteraceae bacterium]|nr:hypothetical protein [Solirubrobacteraceae bacterium]
MVEPLAQPVVINEESFAGSVPHVDPVQPRQRLPHGLVVYSGIALRSDRLRRPPVYFVAAESPIEQGLNAFLDIARGAPQRPLVA